MFYNSSKSYDYIMMEQKNDCVIVIVYELILGEMVGFL
jgi:hypothetical protein